MTLPSKLTSRPPGGEEIIRSATEFETEFDFQSQVLNEIVASTQFLELIYTEVKPLWGWNIVQFLGEEAEDQRPRTSYNSATHVFWARIMPTDLHDCHQEWWQQEQKRWSRSGMLTSAEDDHLRFRVGTTIDFHQSPYSNSRKEPDLLVRPQGVPFPTVVMESGWSESWPRLRDDMNLCLVGGNGAVRAVILLKWARVTGTNSVSGKVELYTLDNQGMPVLQRTETVFPIPSQTNAQRITLTKRMVFGSSILPGSNPNHQLTLEIAELRECATEAMARMGLVPA